MDRKNSAHAPYNFVPFANIPLIPYRHLSDLPCHNKMLPGMKTGEVYITMTADTPVFVSDGNRNDPHFFRAPSGETAIPGSTVRGMARENMQILGFGQVRPREDIEDIQIFYRAVAAKKTSTGKVLQRNYGKADRGTYARIAERPLEIQTVQLPSVPNSLWNNGLI